MSRARGSRHDYDDRGDRGPQDRPPRRRRRNRYLLPILLAAGVGLLGLLLVCVCGGFYLFGIDKTSDPTTAQTTLDEIADFQVPTKLSSCETTKQFTGVVSVEFRSPSGRSFVKLTTGSRFSLNHSGTLREARDRGRVAGGGRAETPAAEETIPATIRGQKAEFICQRYAATETIKGFFQGKQYPVHVEGELDLAEFPAGSAAALARSIR